MKIKVWVALLTAFFMGSLITTTVLTTNTTRLVERTCDNIVRSPYSHRLVCEVVLEHEDDEIVILERK